MTTNNGCEQRVFAWHGSVEVRHCRATSFRTANHISISNVWARVVFSFCYYYFHWGYFAAGKHYSISW